MVKKFLIPIVTAVLALAACSREIQEQRTQSDDSGEVHSLSVEIESGAYGAVEGDTKASMEAVIRVKWKKDDEVSVVNATTGKLLGGCLKAEEDGESVVFTGSVTGTITQGNSLYYIYPRVTNNTEEVDFGSYDISLAAQTYDGKKIGDVCFYGYAQDQAGSADNTISKKIKFTLVTSYAHLNMADLPARNTGLSRIDISNVNEGFTWKLNGVVLSAEAYAGDKAISVRCSNADISKAGNAVARFAIPASAETANDRVVTVNNAYTNDKYVKSELKASAYYNQLYTTWTNSNVSVDASGADKTVVTIDNRNSKDVAEGVIPRNAFGIAGQTPKPSEIKIGGMGTVTFDATASARISGNADQSGATHVLLKVEDVTTTKPVPNADVVYEVTMKTLDENGTEVFPEINENPGTATISIPLDEDVRYVHTIALVDNDGNTISGGVIPESIVLDLTNHILTFKVEHFSKYAVGYVKNADFIPVTGVSLNETALTLPVGDTETLVATITPDNATNKKVTWTSSDETKATVDNTGKITAVAFGQATITVTTEDGNNTATCTVTVTETKTMAELLATNPNIPEVDDLTPPSKAWVNSSDAGCRAFVGIDEDGDKIFTAWKCIPGTEEYAIVSFGLIMEDVFVRTDEDTYTHTEDIVTVIAKMTEGKFTSCEFIFDSSAIQQVIEEGGPDDLAEVPILAGTYLPAVPGVFTVDDNGTPGDTSDDVKVQFSQGNLFYDGSKFDFEAEQYYFRTYEGKGKCDANGYNVSSGTASGHWGLFGWSTDATYNNWGMHIKEEATQDYTTGNFKDWGKAIGDGNTWRTLTIKEWQYLIAFDPEKEEYIEESPRRNLSKTGVTVCGSKNCVVLLPDNWQWDANTVGTDWQKNISDAVEYNEETAIKWSTMEAAGAVCLPDAGARSGSNVAYIGKQGFYWSSTPDGDNIVYNLCFLSSFVRTDSIRKAEESDRPLGFSVRLVTKCQ